ncbi:flagellar motor protein MotB [Alkalimonas collagenimarina]|uniref:Flagellar motor protein MotB n=1 Tax=Alkalimonas collagenimarina TaxID=400390 RepID=A0ABT9H2M2_9GAMM|nr:flagellar motor protein MotB [Alkalimonas collagenimarina]MDP4537560.1 flagellar motor protein MotB [Alkalimonas collagenimarina]
MYRHKKKHQHVEPEELDRWLVSYADYMTLMFALFVVLYAMSIVKDEDYRALSDSLTKIFERPDRSGTGVPGTSVLLEPGPQSELDLYGASLEPAKGPDLVADATELSEVREQLLGTPLSSLEEELNQALAHLMEEGLAKVEQDDNWLTIELNSGLLFASGSATATNSARAVLDEIATIIVPINNFIRVRGYTDNIPINNEIFASNWELSVARSTSVLRLLESLAVAPQRMAIEGYGEHYPIADNTTPAGRAENRRVVIAISKYGYRADEASIDMADTPTIPPEVIQQLENITQDDGSIRVIRLPGGGIRITTRGEEPDPPASQQQEP